MVNRTNIPEHLTPGSHRNGRSAGGHLPPNGMAADEITLPEIFSILLKGKWIITACFLVFLGLTALYTFTQAPEFEASSMLYVNTQQSAPQLGEMLGLEVGNRNVLNEIEILKSRAIAQRVAEELKDQRYVPGTDELLTVLQQDEEQPLTDLQIINRLRKQYVQVRPVSQEVDLINVTATSTVPEEAALIADLFAVEYVEYNRTSSRSRMTASREFLSDVSQRYSDSLESSEEELKAFLNQEQVVAPDEEAKQLLGQVSELQRLQYQTQLELGSVQTELRELQEEVNRIRPGLAEQVASGDNLVVDQLINRIAEKEIEIEELYARNPGLRENPERSEKLMQLQSEVNALREKLDARSKELVQRVMATQGGVDITNGQFGSGGATNKVGVLQNLLRRVTEKRIAANALDARQEIIEAELRQYTQQLSALPRKEIIMNRLQRTLETRQQLYLTLIEKLQEARIAEQSELGYVEVVDGAVTPEEPVRPRVPLNLALGAILGLMLGVGLAFVRNALDNKVRAPDDLRKRGFSVAGVVPSMQQVIKADFEGRERVEVGGHSYSTRLITLLNPLSPIAEAYRRLRTNIRFSRPDGNLRTIMVTSPGPGEGKSVTSMNLAITMAQTGRRTVYVDADLRRANGHRMAGVPREPGLVELLFEPYSANPERFATGVESFYVIPAGSSVPNPAEILGSEKMREFLGRLSKEFDVVVIDTPPVLAVTDALLLSGLADVTVVVCSAGETHWHALDRTVEALHDAGTSQPLVMLNRFDPKGRHGSYGYGYGYGYNDYYGEKPMANV